MTYCLSTELKQKVSLAADHWYMDVKLDRDFMNNLDIALGAYKLGTQIVQDSQAYNVHQNIQHTGSTVMRQYAASQDNGALMQVVQTNDFEIVCSYT